MKRDLKTKVQSLRLEGKTYSEILALLETPVAKSTLSLWCREIKLSDEQRQRIDVIALEKTSRARFKALETIRQKRKQYLEEIHRKYSHLASTMVMNENSAKIALAILQLTEGGKQGGHLMFGNSDPLVISLFLRLIRLCYKIDEAKFRCTVQCRADQNVSELEQYWQKITNISKRQFYKAQIDPRTKGKKSKNPNYKGVCRIDYLSANIYNELTIINTILCKGP